MSRILIADSGSTKTDWAFIDVQKDKTYLFQTPGINPVTQNEDHISIIIGEAFSNIEIGATFDHIYFYGAGCATTKICRELAENLSNIFGCNKCHVFSDLLGAARSLFGTKPGLACILGTGSNSCLYDGHKIIENIPSLGYILGDEGSGNALGKRLLADALKNLMPLEIRKKFIEEFNLSLDSVIHDVYKTSSANRYFASFVPFISKNINHPYFKNLVKEEFDKFFERNIKGYSLSSDIPICFVGSIAFHFSGILRKSAASKNLKIKKIIKSPIEGLIEYHKEI